MNFIICCTHLFSWGFWRIYFSIFRVQFQPNRLQLNLQRLMSKFLSRKQIPFSNAWRANKSLGSDITALHAGIVVSVSRSEQRDRKAQTTLALSSGDFLEHNSPASSGLQFICVQLTVSTAFLPGIPKIQSTAETSTLRATRNPRIIGQQQNKFDKEGSAEDERRGTRFSILSIMKTFAWPRQFFLPSKLRRRSMKKRDEEAISVYF